MSTVTEHSCVISSCDVEVGNLKLHHFQELHQQQMKTDPDQDVEEPLESGSKSLLVPAVH